jgi:hypothetical protein
VSNNPYSSPAAAEATSQRLPSAIVGVRHIYANVVLFAVMLVGYGVFDGLYVMQGQPHGTHFDAIGPILGFLAIVTIYAVNWQLTYTSRWKLRLIVAAGVATAAVAVGIVPWALLGLWFHGRIGGTL